jgi:hypothetical protein
MSCYRKSVFCHVNCCGFSTLPLLFSFVLRFLSRRVLRDTLAPTCIACSGFFLALDLISDLWRASTLRGPTIQVVAVSQWRVALSLSPYEFRHLKPILSRDPFTRKQLVLKNAVFWDVAPCASCKKRRFGEMCHLHFQGRKNTLAEGSSL